MRRMISDTLQTYLKAVKANYPDPTDIGGGTEYTAGTGINISDNNKISINTNKVVTTDTIQDITASKTITSGVFTFKGNMPIHMAVPSNQWTGITIYDSGKINQLCNLQYSDPSKGFYIGRSSTETLTPTYAQELGFKSELGSGSSKTGYKVLMPNKTNITGTASDNVYYIPTEITDGTNTVQANSEGIVDISSLAAPTISPNVADGTYVLKATVSNRTVTYNWVLEV